ncbi:MAG TPA: PEP-CTERM sorting domain-containing protein [Candidatus Eisenbacteria bacterium]|nr:PEP-CTERM sorting domain-containing protein [Candidatus Eisenbacteria bacterium]
MNGNGSSLTFAVDASAPVTYQVIFLTDIEPGTEIGFTFSGGVPVDDANSTFSVLPCAHRNDGALVNQPGIYDTSDTLLTTNCTDLGDYNLNPDNSNSLGQNDPAFTDPSNFITEEICPAGTPGDTVCYTFSGAGLPSEWGFVEASSGPEFVSAEVISSTTPTPEPASLSLLAIGLAGLGVIRRKRAA